jgi:hypothetical protein
MQSVAGIGGKCRVRRRQAFEAVGGKDAATGLAIGVEDAAHVDARAAAPYSGFDKVAPGISLKMASSQRGRRFLMRIVPIIVCASEGQSCPKARARASYCLPDHVSLGGSPYRVPTSAASNRLRYLFASRRLLFFMSSPSTSKVAP